MLLDLLVFVLPVVVAGVAGALLHELAHFIPWWLAGRRPDLDVWALEVRPTAGENRVQWFDRVAAGAPLFLGVLTAPALLLWPRADVWVAWVVFALGGARSDWETMVG